MIASPKPDFCSFIAENELEEAGGFTSANAMLSGLIEEQAAGGATWFLSTWTEEGVRLEGWKTRPEQEAPFEPTIGGRQP